MPRLSREQAKRQDRLAWIRSLPDNDEAPVKASSYVWHVDEFAKAHPEIKQGILACRVSKREQDAHGSLRRQARGLRKLYRDNFDITIVETFKEVGSGSGPLEERTTLIEAIKIAGKLRIPLYIGCVSRLLRNENWKSIDPDWQPTQEQWEELNTLLKQHNVKHVVSYNSPDATPPEDQGFLSLLNRVLLGKQHSGRKRRKYPGYRKDQKAKSIDTVKRMTMEGTGCRRIAKAVERLTGFPVNRKTVLEWVRELDGFPLSGMRHIPASSNA